MFYARQFYAPREPNNPFRCARMARVRSIVDDILAVQQTCSIIDIGGLPSYWRCFAPDIVNNPATSITLVNLSFDKSEDLSLNERENRAFSLAIGDARNLCSFPDKSFDLAHSNSVIEHVGRWSDMSAMATETRRVAHCHFVQTPYWGFPVEPHNRTPIFHWLPEQVRYRLVTQFQLGFWGKATDVDEAMSYVQSAALLDRGQFGALFPSSTIYSEVFWGITKSLVAIGGEKLEVSAHSNTRRLRL